MGSVIPEAVKDLLDKPIVASLSTLMPDGSPQVTPVWFDYDGSNIRINSAKGRVKDKNMRRDPRVAIVIAEPTNPYRYLEIRGRVETIDESGADTHIDSLAKRYMDLDSYPFRTPEEVRVTYVIAPERTTHMNMER